MRTNIEIDDAVLAELMALTGASSKKEAVNEALAAKLKMLREEQRVRALYAKAGRKSRRAPLKRKPCSCAMKAGRMRTNIDIDDAVLLAAITGIFGTALWFVITGLAEGKAMEVAQTTAQQVAGDVSVIAVAQRLQADPVLIAAVKKNTAGELRGMVVGFELKDCPKGWEAYNAGVGKFIVGAGEDGKLTETLNGDPTGKQPVSLTGRKPGDQGGAEKVALGIEDVPQHQHGFGKDGKIEGSTIIASKFDPASLDIGVVASRHAVENGGRREIQVTTASTGGDPAHNNATRPHENMPPFIALTFCKKL